MRLLKLHQKMHPTKQHTIWIHIGIPQDKMKINLVCRDTVSGVLGLAPKSKDINISTHRFKYRTASWQKVPETTEQTNSGSGWSKIA